MYPRISDKTGTRPRPRTEFSVPEARALTISTANDPVPSLFNGVHAACVLSDAGHAEAHHRTVFLRFTAFLPNHDAQFEQFGRDDHAG